jgi:hypothetical protein
MRFAVYAGVGMLSAACGGITTAGPATGGATGYSETGDAGNAGGQAPGSSGAGGASVGSGGAAGSSNASNDTDPNIGSMASQTPSGSLTSCDGTACPGGACGDSFMPPCFTTITSSYEYCEPHANGSHCLAVDSPNGLERWIVFCTSGSVTLLRKCMGACEYGLPEQGAGCN